MRWLTTLWFWIWQQQTDTIRDVSWRQQVVKLGVVSETSRESVSLDDRATARGFLRYPRLSSCTWVKSDFRRRAVSLHLQFAGEDYLEGNPQEKLISSLHGKTKYVLHYHHLKLYLEQGLQLNQIRIAVELYQSFWLRQYISKITEGQKHARNSVDMDFYKLIKDNEKCSW